MLGAGAGIHAPELSLPGGDFTHDGPSATFAYADWTVAANGQISTTGTDGNQSTTTVQHNWALEAPDFDVTTVQVRLDQVAGDAPTLAGDVVALGIWYDLVAGFTWYYNVVPPTFSATGDFTLRMRIKGTSESEVSARYDLTALY